MKLASPHIAVFIVILELAVLEVSFTQECEAQVVLTTQAALKKQITSDIAKALNDFSCSSTTNAPSTESPEALSRLENKLDALNNRIDLLQKRLNVLHEDGSTPCYAASSCAEILSERANSPSGYYWIKNATGHPHSVYCDMTRSCGGVTGGWMRVAKLNMTDSSQQCPSGLVQRNFNNLRTCARPGEFGGCNSLNFTSIVPYSRVCGSVIAYQYGALDAYRIYYNHNMRPTLNDQFTDGVVLTHGNPRRHLWTFIAARDEWVTHSWSGCPCLRPGFSAPPPPFIGNDYFCDTGSRNHFRTDTFYGDDPLWDGAGCESTRGFDNTCCIFNTPPWFYKQLPQPSNDNIEMRVCRHVRNTSDLAIESFEMYVQ